MIAGRVHLRWVIALAAVTGLISGAPMADDDADNAQLEPTVSEQLVRLKAERVTLQARADGEARVGLLGALRIDGLLTDALAARETIDGNQPVEALPPPRRQAYAELEQLQGALKDALARPGDGARANARLVAQRAAQALEALASLDEQPLVLQVTPHLVPPRRATGELTLAPAETGSGQGDGRLQPRETPTGASVPRYAPSFATAPSEEDPPVRVEVVGHRLAADGPPPVLAIGSWRGAATVSPERLQFTVPRSAFGSEAARSAFASGLLTLRRGTRIVTFELLFLVLPDRPGSFAFDQRVRGTVTESNTLVSPEILVRAGAGETKSVRRCFDPPSGWRFDKRHRRVVVVERLGWLADVGDPTLNNGSVDFAPDEKPQQVCVVVSARPVAKAARTATIGRFETTLVRDVEQDRVVKSGVRALDWREAVRVPIEVEAKEWRLYVRLFDEIDRELDETKSATLPFVLVSRDGESMVLTADPSFEP